jgi:pyruvate dehydrogenase (quinone)
MNLEIEFIIVLTPGGLEPMAQKVADVLWEMLVNAGVKRCYGIVGDALNPVIEALRRNGKVDFVHVRNEEYGVFAAVAEAYFTDEPVVVCGTAGPGVVHLFNGLMGARKERAPVVAIAGDVETVVMDTSSLEEMNPYQFFQAASLYTARSRWPLGDPRLPHRQVLPEHALAHPRISPRSSEHAWSKS